MHKIINAKNTALGMIFIWFMVGGIVHFIAPEFFLKIVPPNLPLRVEAVYISGFFEVLGASALLCRKTRRAAGLGLFMLTIAVTPANIYMWQHADLFPAISETWLLLRLPFQAVILALIWWSTQHRTIHNTPQQNSNS